MNGPAVVAWYAPPQVLAPRSYPLIGSDTYMNRLTGLAATGLTLVALYLVLTRAAGATKIVKAVGESTVGIYRTLQGR